MRKMKEILANLKLWQRSLIFAFTFCLILISFCYFNKGKTDYAMLFTNLSTEEVQGIIETLKEKDISYKKSEKDGKNTIFVQSEIVYSTRIALSSNEIKTLLTD